MSLSPIAHAAGGSTKEFAPGDLAKSTAGWVASGDTGATFTGAVDGTGVVVATDGTDNDCVGVRWGGEAIDVGTVGNKFGLNAVIKGTEGNTDDQDWFVGFSDIYDNTFFSDADALASMDAIGFYKVKDSLYFRTCVLNAAAQSGETTTTAYASATEYQVSIEGEVLTDGITVRFYVNGTLVDTVTGVSKTGFSNMSPVLALANGSANAESMLVKKYVPYCVGR